MIRQHDPARATRMSTSPPRGSRSRPRSPHSRCRHVVMLGDPVAAGSRAFGVRARSRCCGAHRRRSIRGEGRGRGRRGESESLQRRYPSYQVPPATKSPRATATYPFLCSLPTEPWSTHRGSQRVSGAPSFTATDAIDLLQWKHAIFGLYSGGPRSGGARASLARVARDPRSDVPRSSSVRRSRPPRGGFPFRRFLRLRPGVADGRRNRERPTRSDRDRREHRSARSRSRGSASRASPSGYRSTSSTWRGTTGYGGGHLPRLHRRDERLRRPTAAAATSSTPSRAPISASTATPARRCSTSTSPSTPRACTTPAGPARSRPPPTGCRSLSRRASSMSGAGRNKMS